MSNEPARSESIDADFSIDTIRSAATRLRGRIARTPLLESPQLNSAVGGRVLVKAESLQVTGSFKIRGAMNAVLSLKPSEREKGIITYSAGNHGQGVAAAAAAVGVPSVVVMPSEAPRNKIERCRWWGAEVVFFDRANESREAVANELIERRGLTFVAPFDHVDTMSGQGTIGLEIAEDLQERGIHPDGLAVNCSGGGLASGVAEGLRHFYPELPITLVEAAAVRKWPRALATGSPVTLDTIPPTVIEGMAGPTTGTLCLQSLRAKNPSTVEIFDDEALRGVKAAFETMRLVVEPAGASSIAALLEGKIPARGRVTVVVASGGNIDPAVLTKALAV
ncbi:threonine/serine dehydratase [Paenarthrobacter sp. NPDC091711]|uniref:threonine ammonia-lyase n=1 Tax=Paenarthrobacter sp. NPDC091711 TaxID=3364385 RepID=UPI00382D7F8B